MTSGIGTGANFLPVAFSTTAAPGPSLKYTCCGLPPSIARSVRVVLRH
jgi:hypothetical protein